MTTSDPARLIVVCGLPGSGKTTLAKGLARELAATYLRVDAVETPLFLAGIDVGPLGYEIVGELAASNLDLRGTVIVDLVNPIPFTRQMWRELASTRHVPLTVFECQIPDATEHRKRVEDRTPDLPGQHVPTWADVIELEYVPWDEARDGARIPLDTTNSADALRTAVQALRR